MSFQKFKSDSYCVGGRHRSATKNIYVIITNKGSEILFGFCALCKKKSMTVSNNIIQAENFSDFLRSPDKNDLRYQKKWQKMFQKTMVGLLKLLLTLVLHLHLVVSSFTKSI